MITINLLPQEARKQEKKDIVPLTPLLFIALIVILVLHTVLGLFGLVKKMQLGILERSWTKVQPQLTEMSEIKKELEEKQKKAEALTSIAKRTVYWTDFFNKINAAVPKGLWLNRLSLSEQGFVIEGSVFSFNIDQISLVNKFFDELKKDVFFQMNFSNFSLDSVQRRSIKQYEILDFVLTAKLTTLLSDTDMGENERKVKR